MENKIKVKVQKQDLRLQIPYEDGVIIINEIHPQLKDSLLQEIIEVLNKKKELDEKQIFLTIVDKCTNVEFDGDIFVEQYVSHEIQMLINEIMIMIQEVIQEAYQILRLVLQQAKNEIVAKEVINEVKTISVVEEKVEEKVEVKRVRKPKSRRHSMH